jgi:hypothetical protein
MSDFAEDENEADYYQQVPAKGVSNTPSANLLNKFYHASADLEIAACSNSVTATTPKLNYEESKENNSADSNKPSQG